VVTRALLYTAITRARGRVEVWGSEAVVRAAVATGVERSSGLRDALWGLDGGR
jgi:exodeoxyribonuclease V alpha subunit